MPDTSAVIEAMPGREIPGVVHGVLGAGLVWGAIAIIYGFAVAGQQWTWGAYIVALVYVLAIAQGGVLFGVMMTLTHGRWGVPVKRIAESFGFFLPVGYLLLLVLLVLGQGLYPWNPGTFMDTQMFDANGVAIDGAFAADTYATNPHFLEPHSPAAYSAKPLYLSWTFWFLRQAGSMGLIIVMSMMYLRWSLRPDMLKTIEHLNGTNPSWKPPSWWSYFTSGGADLDTEVAKAESQRDLFGALIAILYPFVFSLLTFDLIMSLAPWWFANMFGAWFMVSSFWIALCAVGIVSFIARDWLAIKPFVTSTISHDIGKLALALSMFWAYTTYAQILPIWYANMPEETDFLLIRMYLPTWSWMARTVAVLCFITPFTALLSRGLKKMKAPFIAILALIMIGLFLERTLQVMPSVYFGETFPTVNFIVVNLGLVAGMGALLGICSVRVLASVPPMPISDPHLATHPWDQHVHSLDHAHH